jgi:hypothetical protein
MAHSAAANHWFSVSDSVVLKFEGEAGGNEGDRLFKATHASYVFYDIIDTGSNYIAVGRDETNSDLAVVGLKRTDGSVDWSTHFSEAEYAYSINKCAGGFIIAGYALDGAVKVGYLLKINGTGEKEWSQTYTENSSEDTVFMDAKEAKDKGFLAIGYQMDSTDDSRWEYTVKTNRYGETCSTGTPCN